METSNLNQEWNRILADDTISQELKNSEQFKKCFMKRYSELQSTPGFNIKCYLENGRVILSGFRDWKDETAINERCQGLTTRYTYSFGLEYQWDREYFCERTQETEVARYIQTNKSDAFYSAGMRVFYGDEEMGHATYSKYVPETNQNFYGNSRADYDLTMPTLSIGEVFNCATPSRFSDSSNSCRIRYEASARETTGSNIVKTIITEKENNKLVSHLLYYGDVNYDYPETLDNISSNCYGSFDMLNNVTYIKAPYKSLDECLNAYRRNYNAGNGLKI